MKYLFLGSFCSEDEEEYLLSISKVGLQSSIINFQRNMLQGLKCNMNEEDTLDVINYYPLGTWPKTCKKLFIDSFHTENYQRLRLINIPLIKQLYYNFQAKQAINKWIKANKTETKFVLMYDMLRPYIKVLSKLKKDSLLTRCSIVADLLNEYGYKKNDNAIKKYFKSHIGYDSMSRINKLDIFGLLTMQMSEPLHIDKKRFVIIEGFSNIHRYYNPISKGGKKILLYTGVLSSEYQLDVLLDAFQTIKNNNYELWLCGTGPLVFEILKRARNDDRIKYLGYKSHLDIVKLQSEALLLINPRQNKGEYTKYSFPSKIIEYLSTARPILAYRLDGVSEDYYNYIFVPDNNSVESLKNKILEVTNMSYNELNEIGLKGREFVIERTFPSKQIAKLLDLAYRK